MSDPPVQSRSVVPVAAIASLVGIGCLFLMTRWGIGTSPDSVHYIRAARQLLGEEGEVARASAQFAPLYSFLLAGGGLFGLDPVTSARWLNIIVFGLNVFLVGSIIRHSSRNVAWLWMLGSLVVVGSVPVLSAHVTALSEPVFVFFGLWGLYLLGRYLETETWAFLLGSAGAIALACLTRYAGAALIITGVVALLLWAQSSFARRVRDLVVFGAIGALPTLAWMTASLTAGGSATGREFLFHPIGRAHVWQAIYTASSWFLIPPSTPNVVRLGFWLALAVVVAATLVRARPPKASVPPVVRVLALFLPVYGAFLAASISFLDANTPLDDRILLPAYAAGLIALLWVVGRLWLLTGGRPVLAKVFATVVLVFAALHVTRGAGLVAESYTRGWGFSSVEWQQSGTLARVRTLPEGVLLYSNAPEIVYLHTGRRARPIPKKVLLMSRQLNREFSTEVADARHDLAAACGVVAYFRNVMEQKSLPSEEEIRTEMSLRVREEESDGAILSPSACPLLHVVLPEGKS